MAFDQRALQATGLAILISGRVRTFCSMIHLVIFPTTMALWRQAAFDPLQSREGMGMKFLSRAVLGLLAVICAIGCLVWGTRFSA